MSIWRMNGLNDVESKFSDFSGICLLNKCSLSLSILK